MRAQAAEEVFQKHIYSKYKKRMPHFNNESEWLETGICSNTQRMRLANTISNAEINDERTQ